MPKSSWRYSQDSYYWYIALANLFTQSEIRQISSDSASDVDDWIRNAKAIHDDIDKSRKLASSIVRQAEEDEQRLEGLQQQQEVYMEFLSKEAHYNTQLLSCLGAIQQANEMLRKVEDQAAEHNVVDALYTLSGKLCSSVGMLTQTLYFDSGNNADYP